MPRSKSLQTHRRSTYPQQLLSMEHAAVLRFVFIVSKRIIDICTKTNLKLLNIYFNQVQEFESLETPTAPVYDVVSSKEESSRCQLETNPKTDPTNCEPANTIVLPSVSPQDVAASKCDVAVIRDKSLRESKSSSKRNSLDNKTVQTLAQDLAAECAKAYAMMENSLSKLSTDFAVGPFGLTPKKVSLIIFRTSLFISIERWQDQQTKS